MPVRIYEIAKKLGIESKDFLAKAKELGIAGARVPSSSLDKITAEYLESHFQPAAPKPEAPPPPPAPVTVISAPPEPIAEPPPAEPVPAGMVIVESAPVPVAAIAPPEPVVVAPVEIAPSAPAVEVRSPSPA